MADEIELVKCAYEQCGVAYNTAVDVTKFTWQMFYTSGAALLAAAGYILLYKPRFAWLAAGLLALGALSAWHLTRPQIIANQNVIRKVMAAGLYLEKENKALGYRFRLDALGHRVDEESTMEELWMPATDDDLAKLRLRDLGLTPNLEGLCRVYVLLYSLFALICLIYWIVEVITPALASKRASLTNPG
ncbi:MAG: hypothetical protein O7D91_13340 [Planctomycetota bacterium]|nr:hypothetical protein [Planctomycetota bacterium]